MYLRCTTEEASRRQRQFARLLLDAMDTQRYAEITIGHLCKEAGTSRTAFYRYFECKDDVLDLLITMRCWVTIADSSFKSMTRNPTGMAFCTFCNTGSTRSSFWMRCKKQNGKQIAGTLPKS